jgi:hypothetical protein
VQEDYGSGLRYLFQYISLIANMEYNASNSLATEIPEHAEMQGGLSATQPALLFDRANGQ